jgi:hypothetical protein
MNYIGYIVQVFDEDQMYPNMGVKRLHTNYNDAIIEANLRIKEFMLDRDESIEGPYEIHKNPTQEELEDNGRLLMFESRDIIIWIDCIVW